MPTGDRRGQSVAAEIPVDPAELNPVVVRDPSVIIPHESGT